MTFKRADELMADGLETFAKKRAVYGASYIKHAAVMKEIFPDGLPLKTDLDFARFSILNLMIAKIIRYSNLFHSTGLGAIHSRQDSIHDTGVYSFVLEELEQFVSLPEEWEAWKKSQVAQAEEEKR